MATVAGCLTTQSTPGSGLTPQKQSVRVQAEQENGVQHLQIALSQAMGENTVRISVAEEFDQVVDDRGDVHVDDSLAEHLTNRFKEVSYRLRLCADNSDCAIGSTTRRNLNRISYRSNVRALNIRRNWRVFSVDSGDEPEEWQVHRYEFSIEDHLNGE